MILEGTIACISATIIWAWIGWTIRGAHEHKKRFPLKK